MVELPELEPKYSPTPLPSKEYMRSGAAAGPGVNTCDFPAGAELATLQKCRRVPLGTDMPGISCLRSPAAAKRPNTGHIRQSISSRKKHHIGPQYERNNRTGRHECESRRSFLAGEVDEV